jgi:preprotein translocase subunit SecD
VAVIAIAITIILLGYFTAEPIAKSINLGLDLRGGLRVVLEAQETEGKAITEDTITKALGILRTRVDSLGVKETTLYPQGNNRVVIEIAGEDDPEAAVDILKNVAQLEFQDEQGNVLVTGENLQNAEARMDRSGTGNAEVILEFDKKGAQLFAEATRANVGKPLLIVIDNQVISAPNVNEPITDGNAVIQGKFTAEEAQNLAVQLRSGALPVSFNVLEKRSVGPTLGADSLDKSLKAGIIGLIAVLIFMLGYYRLPGLIADLSLVIYMMLVLGTMSLLGAVLTLPGIAGLALSVGMAVDANVVTYERIRRNFVLAKPWGRQLRQGLNEPSGPFLTQT